MIVFVAGIALGAGSLALASPRRANYPERWQDNVYRLCLVAKATQARVRSIATATGSDFRMSHNVYVCHKNGRVVAF